MGSSSGHSQQVASQTSTSQDTSKQVLPFKDNRPATFIRRTEMDSIANSPRTVAQRQGFVEAFGGENPDPKQNTTGMPETLKAGLESLSAIDLSDVKVHYNSS